MMPTKNTTGKPAVEALRAALPYLERYYKQLPDDGPEQDFFMLEILEPARKAASHDPAIDALALAIARVEIENAEGNPIMRAWLPGAKSIVEQAQ